jgi:hypothetical protein
VEFENLKIFQVKSTTIKIPEFRKRHEALKKVSL